MNVSGAERPSTRERAFEELIREHQASIWRYLRFLGCEEEQAADLVQETFLSVWRRPFEVRTSAAARSYLRCVAKNLFLMQVRRNRARPALHDLDGADRVWATVEEDDGARLRNALEDCLEELAKRARQALDLFYRDGASRVGIAEALGMTADGVKTLMRRARETLRGCVQRRLLE